MLSKKGNQAIRFNTWNQKWFNTHLGYSFVVKSVICVTNSVKTVKKKVLKKLIFVY